MKRIMYCMLLMSTSCLIARPLNKIDIDALEAFMRVVEYCSKGIESPKRLVSTFKKSSTITTDNETIQDGEELFRETCEAAALHVAGIMKMLSNSSSE